MRKPRGRMPAFVMVLVALVLASVAAPVTGDRPASVASASSSAMASVMEGIEEGTAGGATEALVGWGLGAIGLNSAQDQQFAVIESQLATISNQLTDIEDELTTLSNDITTQTCALETFDTTTAARAQIDTLIDELQQFEAAGATSAQLDQFVVDVLGTGSSIETEMNVINDALLNAGTANGIISSCLATITNPASGTAGDTAYYDLVSNLTMFFYGYQVNGLDLIVEAYHYQALNEWLKSNPASSLTVADVDSICVGAAGDVAVYCNDALYWTTKTYQNLQDQFALAGAPYSVAGSALTMNGTPYLFVSSLEGFSSTEGSSCSSPLTSASPCGPTSGTNLLTSFSQLTAFANRSDWTPATAAAWQAVTQWWTTPGQTLGTYLADLGFSNTTNGTKIVLTNDTYSATPSEYVNGNYQAVFTAQAACFVDFSLPRSFSSQPFCDNTDNNAFNLVSKNGYYNNDFCAYVTAPDSLPTDASNSYFYVGTYDLPGAGSCNSGWENGTTPGWLLKSAGYTDVQYLWPMFDMAAASCGTNADGSARSTTNAGGVYTMCGADFDTWFATVVPTPTASSTTASAPSASLSSATIAQGDQFSVSTRGWDGDTSVAITIRSTSVVLDQRAVDAIGNLTRTYTMPTDAPVGAQTITLDGTFGGTPYTVTLDVVVTARPQAASPVAATPRLTG